MRIRPQNWYYKYQLRKTISIDEQQTNQTEENSKKFLYASPVGTSGKKHLKKIIERFGHAHFDYLIFAYDDDPFDEDIFKRCRIIREKGYRWYFMKKYVTPEVCKKYRYIFVWADDIDIEDFSYNNFISIMERNQLQIAQPALGRKSYFSHAITTVKKWQKFGRYVDFVEIMVPVFQARAWETFWQYLDPVNNPWGWGCDLLAHSLCGFTNMGIVDCEPVTHTRPVSSGTKAGQGKHWFLEKHKQHKKALKINIMSLK